MWYKKKEHLRKIKRPNSQKKKPKNASHSTKCPYLPKQMKEKDKRRVKELEYLVAKGTQSFVHTKFIKEFLKEKCKQ